MSFSFDPDLIEMPIGHHIGGHRSGENWENAIRISRTSRPGTDLSVAVQSRWSLNDES